MNVKYFIRGLGVGIVFSAIILAIVLKGPQKEQLSDDEIKSRAIQMGMVEPTDEPIKEKLEKTQKDPSVLEPKKETPAESNMKEETPETDKKEIKDTPKDTTDSATKPKEEEKEDKTEKPKEEKKDIVNEDKEPVNNSQKIAVTIKRGMYSNHVADELKRVGVIKDSKEFDRYLVQYGYQSKIMIGSYEISSDATYEQIAKLITAKK